jgi:hypothetical protein
MDFLKRLPQLQHPFADRLGHFAGAEGGGVVAVGFDVVGHKNTYFDDPGDGSFERRGGGFAEILWPLGLDHPRRSGKVSPLENDNK